MKVQPICFALALACVLASGVRADHYDDLATSIADVTTGNAQFESDDARLYSLFDAIWEWEMHEFPTYATYVGYPGQNDHWMDNSFAAEERRKRVDVVLLDALRQIDVEELSESAKLDWRLLSQAYENSIEGHAFPAYLMPINQLSGVQDDIARTISMMPASKEAEFEDILARLDSAPEYIANELLRLRRGLEQGITPPQVTLRDLPSQFDSLLVEDPTETPFWKPFKAFPTDMPQAVRDDITERAATIITQELQPALLKLRMYLQMEYIPNAREEVGLSNLPDGADWYAYSAKVRTTTDLTPNEIHQIGLGEVARLSAKMRRVIEETGFDGSFEEFKVFMQEDDRFYYEDPEALLIGYRDICKRADAELVKLFGTLPRLPYGVEVVAEHIAPSAPTAYYMGGSLEAGRPGYFYANTYDLRARPKWGMEALSLHEAVPGHHLQISIAKELGELHDLRKHLSYTAYVEGWGLYAETLGYEMGFYKDPYARIGQISYEMWRAIRLVVDTGMHALGWTRQEAIDYFKQHSIMLEHDITVEIDRYIVWPGQALAYKIGQLKYQELRDRARSVLGEAFDVRAFHDQLLASGAIPLNILESRITAWIESKESDLVSD